MTAADRAGALSALIHREYLDMGCTECRVISGLLTGMVAMARNGHAGQVVESLIAEAARDLDLLSDEDAGLPPTGGAA